MKAMHRGVWLGLMAAAALSWTAGGCGDDETTTATSGGASCAPSDPACPAIEVGTDCLGLADNSGKDTFALRLSQLSITAPEALTTQTVYKIIGDGVNPNLDSCGVTGLGTFNLITEFDKTADTLRVGGALPEADPTTGYCFANDPANEIAPTTVKANLQPDGTFSPDPLDYIVVPIYLDLMASSAVYLPLRGATFTGKLSADQNCIGRFNSDGLEPLNLCKPDVGAGIEYFVNDGTLEGHIRIEEADAVQVDLLNQSLCVLLSGDPNTYGDGADPQRCVRDGDGNITLEGDWCSETNSAGGCKDSFRLGSQLAASSAILRSDCPASPTTATTTTGGGGGAGGAGTGGASAGGAGGS